MKGRRKCGRDNWSQLKPQKCCLAEKQLPQDKNTYLAPAEGCKRWGGRGKGEREYQVGFEIVVR